MTTTHFKIDGEWLTDFVRTRVRENRWDYSIKLLVNELSGMTYDIAMRILKGDARLTGVNDLDLADDDDQVYKEQIKYQFAGCYVDGDGKYLRPYAVITSWGSDDLFAKIPLTKGSITVLTRNGRNASRSALYYADDTNNDVVAKSSIKGRQFSEMRGLDMREEIILCRVMNNFPHMLVEAAPLNRIDLALDDFYASGKFLEERGYSRTFPEDQYKVRLEREFEEDVPEITTTFAAQPDQESARDDQAAIRERYYRANPEMRPTEEKIARTDNFFKQIKKADIALGSIDVLRQQIVEQAGDDFFDLEYVFGYDGEKRSVRIPTAPFENWSLWRTKGAHLAKPWKTICPRGMKMMGDDPYHSDWMVGAGLELDAFQRDHELRDAAFEKMNDLQKEKLRFECTVLCGSGDHFGRAVHPKRNTKVGKDEIAILPNAGPAYLEAALTASAVIVEKGGEMAHLVSIAREHNFTIVRVDDARKLYPEGVQLRIVADEGRIVMQPGATRSMLDPDFDPDEEFG